MCTIKVCTAEDDEWSIDKIGENGDKERLSSGNDDKTVRDLLSKMSGQENEQLRGKKISAHAPLYRSTGLSANVMSYHEMLSCVTHPVLERVMKTLRLSLSPAKRQTYL